MANEKSDEVIVIPVGKYLSTVRNNPWMIVSIILLIALIVVFLWKPSSSVSQDEVLSGNVISEKDASDNLLKFINQQGKGNAELVSITSVGPYYEAQLKYQGQEFPAHITKDGNFLVLNSIPLTPDAPKLAQAEPPKQTEPIEVDISESPSRGSKDAKVLVVEFTDYECPFCRKFYDETYQKLMDEYVLKGKVLLVMKDFPLVNIHENALKAAEAARCVREQKGDEGYFKMHDKLFENQENLSVENYAGLARQLGVMGSKFESCLNESKYESAVQKDMKLGQEIGITGTPSFVINGKLISGSIPYEAFKQLIEQELGQ